VASELRRGAQATRARGSVGSADCRRRGSVAAGACAIRPAGLFFVPSAASYYELLPPGGASRLSVGYASLKQSRRSLAWKDVSACWRLVCSIRVRRSLGGPPAGCDTRECVLCSRALSDYDSDMRAEQDLLSALGARSTSVPGQSIVTSLLLGHQARTALTPLALPHVEALNLRCILTVKRAPSPRGDLEAC